MCCFTLYGFCDASKAAYAAAVYLVIRLGKNTHTQFLVAKTRVAPMQTITIPKLELLSASILSRLITTASSVLESSLSDLRLQCYTDSMVALYWIRVTIREWRPFVQNRVNEIRKKTPLGFWHHCSEVANPADLPSRGITMSELQVNLWHYGPDWLDSTLILDNTSEPSKLPEDHFKELKASKKKTHNLAATEVKHTIGDFIQCKRFSNFRRLLRITAYVMIAVKMFKSKRAGKSSGPLSTEELSDAERRWIEDSQGSLECEKLLLLL